LKTAETVLSKRRRELKEALRQKALDRLGPATALLYAEGAEEVYVFGSVLKPAEFNEHSDVDIAVKGITGSNKLSIESRLEELFVDIPFDIVFLEDAVRPEITARILKEGLLWKP